MRLGTAPRRRSWAWWGVFFVALLTIGAYVIFDILDVDGSQMTGRPADAIIAAEALQVEVDRFFRADTFTPDLTGSLHLSVLPCFPTEIHGLLPVASILRARLSRMFPRVNPHRDMLRVSSPSADPA